MRKRLLTVVLLGLMAVGLSAFGLREVVSGPVDKAPAKSLAEELPRIPPKEPAEALRSFEVQDGFRMELIAHEPLLTDPVAAVHDENGLLYVVEMRGYPFPEKMGENPIGLVRVLEDADGDGKMDRSDVLVDRLSWPTGIAAWKGGVFVAAAPDIWYFKDTNGDRKADIKRKVFTGFGKNNVQALLNNLVWGLDNRIYGATAGNGGQIRPGDKPDAKPVSVQGRDFRFDPETDTFEAISGTAQFGNSFDDWNNRFVCSNSNHAQQVVLESRYLARNPYFPVPGVIKMIAKDGGSGPVFRISSAEPWRVVRTRRRNADGKNYAPTERHAIGFFTSATGVTIYRGDAYPEKYHGNLFVGDVGGNLIHRKTLQPDGVTFLAVRADENTEFIRSTDNWFRPVNFVNAPDGTLHVLDMYRETIEHPISIPEDIKAFLDLENGRDRGRIYRLTPPGFKVPPIPKLGEASIAELVVQLENPNGWWRDTAHRLIHERQDKSAIEPIRKLLASSSLPQGRLHALWSLEGLASLTEADLLAGLADQSAGVREHAVRLAESRLDRSPALLEKVLALAADPEPRVRLQVAFSLGESKSPRVVEGLAQIARADAGDPWIRTALLSSSATLADRLLLVLLGDAEKPGDAGTLLGQLALVVGARNQASEVKSVLTALGEGSAGAGQASVQRAVLVGLGDGLKRSRGSLSKLLADRTSPAGKVLDAILEQARTTADDAAADPTRRAQAIEILGLGDFARVRETLEKLLDARQPQPVQLSAIRALTGFSGPEVATMLLKPWKSFTPPIRGEIIEALAGRAEWLGPFLDTVEDKTIVAGQINPTRKTVLLKHPNATIRERAQKLFGADAPSPRAEVVISFKPALSLVGDRDRGQKIFERECMTCHKVGDKGHEVGPNLATIQNRTPEALMIQVLDPNREVLPNYIDYLVATDEGRIMTGLIATETATSITLKRAQNAQDTILRQNIEQITSTGKSLMPEEMEKKIKPAEMADLIAFLLDLKKP